METVYITGIGSMTSFGQNTDELWKGLLAGVAAVKSIPDQWKKYAESSSQIYAPFTFDLDAHPCPISKVEILQHDPSALIAILSAHEALTHAGLSMEIKNLRSNRISIEGVDSSKMGVVAGTSIGGLSTTWENSYQYLNAKFMKELEHLDYKDLREKVNNYFPYKQKRLNNFYVPRSMPNSVSDMVAMKFSASAFSETHCYACASGTTAIGKAYQHIASGAADIIIAIGSDYLALPVGVIHKGFDLAEALTKDSIDDLHGPFDRKRTGFTYSEGGAGAVILESKKHLEKRKGKALAELSAYVQNFECYSMLAMEPSGKHLKQLHDRLLDQASCIPADVDYISAHGTGTHLNDKMEANVISSMYPRTTLVNSTKSMLGHTIGAAGAIECVATVKQMMESIVHPNANLVDPLDGITLPTEKTHKEINIAVSTSYAFGGHNAAILLKKV